MIANRHLWRLPTLLLVTASAVGATDYLLDPHSERMSAWACWTLLLASWTTVLLAWRRHRPYLRGWSGGKTFGVLVLEVLFVSVVHFSLFPCPLRPNTPEEQQFVDLTTAVANNDLGRANAVLARDRNPDYLPPRDEVTAASSENWEAVTPLQSAVTQGRVEIARALIAHGASATDNGSWMLVAAARNDDVPMLRLLVANGVPVNDFNGGDSRDAAVAGVFASRVVWRQGSTALWDAVGDQKADAVAFLLGHGANPYTRPPDSNSFGDYANVLRLARSTDNIPIAKMLKKAGATE